MSNRLARERSPYLLQHADNPVEWYPWGDEAFARARAEDKPIFLSIGYSTCHWCHVMAHESFEDAEVAAVLNEHFVSIKLDREERPDVDRVYMMFVQATTGAGGWPMSVWLTPDLKPFFGGTYFPPTSRWGRPGFVDVLKKLAEAWRQERETILSDADGMVERLRSLGSADDPAPDRAPVAGLDAVEAGIGPFVQAFDQRFGGFGAAPKFPRPVELFFLMRAYAATGDRRARGMALETLRAMAMGGMRDHVGGGFHRYSVDAEWRVPHFEKMLYDQAQLVLAYLEGAQVSGEDLYSAVAEDTLDYVRRDLTAADGAFYSAEDADSLSPQPGESTGGHRAEKREGAFYVWTAGELDRVLGDDAPVVGRRFGVDVRGNALSDPQGEFEGQNILYVAQSIDDVAVRTGRSVDDVMAALARGRAAMFETRRLRPRPHLDDKVLTAWNGLMVGAFARAARVLVDSPRREEWRTAAERAASWIRDRLWIPGERRLLRRFRAGEAAIEGFCEDYAYLVHGVIELFQATGDAEWLEWALELNAVQTERFFDDRDGGWFSTTGTDRSVLLRLKEDYDGAEPAAASVTVGNLLMLGHIVADQALRQRAGRTLERYGPQIGRAVRVMPLMVSTLVLWHAAPVEIVIVGRPDADDRRALERVAARHYLPAAITILRTPGQSNDATSRRLPWLAAMDVVGGRAAAYVCQNFTCRAPLTDPDALDAAVKEVATPRRVIG
jgi:uncharacterized protein YyaL (SSP411 family)